MQQYSFPMADVQRLLEQAQGPQKALCEECGFFRELEYSEELEAHVCKLCK